MPRCSNSKDKLSNQRPRQMLWLEPRSSKSAKCYQRFTEALALRIQTSSVNATSVKLIEITYATNIKFVTDYSAKLIIYNDQVVTTTASLSIDTLIATTMDKNEVYAAKLKGYQEARAAVATERKYAEIQIVEHFDSGATQQKAGIKLNLTDLTMPSNVTKGKGVELIKNIKSFLKGRARAPWFYTILPEVFRTLEEPRIENHHKPPSKADGYVYAGVQVQFREIYNLQAQELYDQMEAKFPKEITANIRKQFKYGLEDEKAVCQVEDGPMVIFCILALYRPSGETYRNEIKEKMCALPTKFSNGTNPAQMIHENQAIMQETLDLDIRIPWCKTGKPIISILSERSNTFARVLRPYIYAEAGGVLDKDDSAVELNRMLTDIVDACKKLQESGLDVKKAMNVD
jgi:hypothetical protein